MTKKNDGEEALKAVCELAERPQRLEASVAQFLFEVVNALDALRNNVEKGIATKDTVESLERLQELLRGVIHILTEDMKLET